MHRRNGPGRLHDPASGGKFPAQARFPPGLSKNCTKPAEVRVPRLRTCRSLPRPRGGQRHRARVPA
jgi:hypothetical protein